MDELQVFTPPQLAKLWAVAPEKVIGWILAGELEAVNFAARLGGRPRYRITREAKEAFERRRAVVVKPAKVRRTADYHRYV